MKEVNKKRLLENNSNSILYELYEIMLKVIVKFIGVLMALWLCITLVYEIIYLYANLHTLSHTLILLCFSTVSLIICFDIEDTIDSYLNKKIDKFHDKNAYCFCQSLYNLFFIFEFPCFLGILAALYHILF